MIKQQGFGLSEVLISLFLASIIVTTLTQFYLSTKAQYMQMQKILASRFDLQWVGDLLADSVRRAGFTPCTGIDQLQVKDRRSFARTVHGLLIEQDSIHITRMNEYFFPVLKIHGLDQLLVQNSVPINEKRPIVIADCIHAEIHEIAQVTTVPLGTLITLTKPLMFSYTAGVSIGEWMEERWFIRTNPDKNQALYYQLVQTEEISASIHSLTVKMQRVHDKSLLEVALGLDEDKSYNLVVAARGS